jgi:superfamily II DNA or RNA helicase
MTPSVDIVPSEVRFLDGRTMPWASKVNHLCYNQEYVRSVSMIAAAYAAQGHKVLVVSNRVYFLKVCAQLVGDNAVHVTGDMDHAEREETIKQLKKDKNVLFGTQSIFSEGISINELSCIVLATPINNEPLLTQLIGRIIRKEEGKLQPKVVDIHLKGKTASRQNQARLGYYMKQGYEVTQL